MLWVEANFVSEDTRINSWATHSLQGDHRVRFPWTSMNDSDLGLVPTVLGPGGL